MAVPYVLGTIAGMQQAYPGITLEQIRQTLQSTGKNLAGYKQVQSGQAALAAKALKPAPVFSLKPGSGIEAAYHRYGGSATFGALPVLSSVSVMVEQSRTSPRTAISTGARAPAGNPPTGQAASGHATQQPATRTTTGSPLRMK